VVSTKRATIEDSSSSPSLGCRRSARRLRTRRAVPRSGVVVVEDARVAARLNTTHGADDGACVHRASSARASTRGRIRTQREISLSPFASTNARARRRGRERRRSTELGDRARRVRVDARWTDIGHHRPYVRRSPRKMSSHRRPGRRTRIRSSPTAASISKGCWR